MANSVGKELSGPHNHYVSRAERNLCRNGLAECLTQLLPAGTVLVASRAPIGCFAIAKNSIATTQVFRNLILKPGSNPKSVFHWLKADIEVLQPYVSRSPFQGSSGTALAQIHTRYILVRLLPEERTLASILGTLDHRIDLNRGMSETLEQMARALFKAWFVDFEPVRAKMEGRWRRGVGAIHESPLQPGLPAHLYDLFPDRLVPSELGEIPEGWSVGRLGDVAESQRRTVQPGGIEPDTPYIALEHMPRGSITLSDWGTADGLESSKFEFKKGEVLFGKLRPYFHKVGVAPVNGVCSTDIVVVAPRRPDWCGFVLGHMSSVEFVEYTDATSTGTNMPRTSWADMARYEVVLPPEPVAGVFTRLIQPTITQIIAGIHQSRTLAALPDALLPKLISGELRVKDAEGFLKERGVNR